MLDWLVGSFEIFGVAIQNWMALIAAGLAAYAIVLTMARRRPQGLL